MFAFRNAETRMDTGFEKAELRVCDTLYLYGRKQTSIGLPAGISTAVFCFATEHQIKNQSKNKNRTRRNLSR